MKYMDENGLLYLIQKIQNWDNNKVDKVNGKGLSTNDFDATYKAALDNLATNYVAAVSGKGLSTNDYDDTEKAKVAAAQTASDVTTAIEGYGYQTAAQVTTAITGYGYQTASDVSAAIATALGNITGIEFVFANSVADLPATGAKGTIYLVPNSGSGNNSYDEYVWITIGTGNEAVSRYEKIGTTDIDLSGYVQSSSLSAITNAEIDTIVTTASGSGS